QEDGAQTRRTILVGACLCVVAILLVYVAAEFLGMTLTSGNFLALLIACCCAQLALAPLLLPALLAPLAGVSAAWALAIVAVAAGTGIAVVGLYAVTGGGPWLWAAIPACLGSGGVLFLVARFAQRS